MATSIYEAIRRVALGENPRLVLMDMVPDEEDGGEAFIEEDADNADDELESDDELEIPEEGETVAEEGETVADDDDVVSDDEIEAVEIDPGDIPIAEELES